MKLAVETDAANAQRYQTAFDAATKELGIADKPFTLWLTFTHEPPEIDFVDDKGFALRVEGGATFNDITDGYVRMTLNTYKLKCTCRGCREATKNSDLISVFCHEMAHVKQLVTGELSRESATGLWWHGKLYDPLPDYEDMPWEHDADALHAKLYPKVLAALGG